MLSWLGDAMARLFALLRKCKRPVEALIVLKQATENSIRSSEGLKKYLRYPTASFIPGGWKMAWNCA